MSSTMKTLQHLPTLLFSNASEEASVHKCILYDTTVMVSFTPSSKSKKNISKISNVYNKYFVRKK